MAFSSISLSTRGSSESAFSSLQSVFENNNFSDVGKISAISTYYSENELHYGSTYIGFVTAVVPRSFWQDKPAVFPGKEITRRVFKNTSEVAGAIPPGFVGESLMNFGIVGAIIIALLLGIHYGLWDNMIRSYFAESAASNKQGLKVVFIVISIEMGYRLLSGSFSQMLLGIIEIVPFYLIIKLAKFKWN